MSDDAVVRLREAAEAVVTRRDTMEQFTADAATVVLDLLARLDAAERQAAWAVDALREVEKYAASLDTVHHWGAVIRLTGYILTAVRGALAKIKEDAP